MKTSHHHFYKERTPSAFNTLLLSHPYFAKHWKVIPSVFKALNQILKWNHLDGEASEITWAFFKSRFGFEYPHILKALESLALLQITPAYLPQEVSPDGKGHCKRYLCSAKGHALLADVNKEYLYKLLTDPQIKRTNQRRIRERKYHSIQYGDIRDELKASIDGITFDWNRISPVVDTFKEEKRAFTYTLLTDIEEKNYGELRHNEKDNRVWNPYTQLPAEIKALITINGLRYQHTLDIRSCYPSLWAEYLIAVNVSCSGVIKSNPPPYCLV